MCFTPFVSISVAVIEFILATILVLLFQNRVLRNFSAALIYLLGFYQFTEFMLCTSGFPIFWARVGFVTYTLLPAISLHAALSFSNKKPNYFIIYIIPLIFEAIAFCLPIVTGARCQTFFVEVDTLLYAANPFINNLLFNSYSLYYFLFILLSCLVFYSDYRKNKNKIVRRIDLLEILGVVLMTVPTITFIFILPFLGRRFPSVLCGFAIFVSITSYLAVYLESKIHKK